MEHLPDPNGFLKGISNNLAPGAVGLVEVPNFDMIQRKKIFYEFMRDHLYYFTQETLKTTLRINGFEILDCREVWHDYIISAVVRRREPAPLSSLVEQERKIKCDIEKFFELIGSTRVAVWGAGHQALALLALMGLSKRIRYVIDSAPFKQGKVTPATHVPIVSPAALASDPVDAVMVMAGSYSDEVVATLRKSHPAMRVSVLRDNGMEYVQNSRE
jgi:hypothetical protein